jgi:hypothetical protein
VILPKFLFLFFTYLVAVVLRRPQQVHHAHRRLHSWRHKCSTINDASIALVDTKGFSLCYKANSIVQRPPSKASLRILFVMKTPSRGRRTARQFSVIENKLRSYTQNFLFGLILQHSSIPPSTRHPFLLHPSSIMHAHIVV